MPKQSKLQHLFEAAASVPQTDTIQTDRNERLLEISKWLTDHKVSYFLVLGTCLGAVREKSFITYDHDVDIAIHANEMETLSNKIKALEKTGIFIEEVTPSNLRLKIPGCEATFDLWIIYPVNLYYKCLGYKWAYNNGLFKPNYFQLPATETATINGHTYPVPHTTESYLVEHYGETWRIPQKGMNAIYRGYLSQLINVLFFTSNMPAKFSGVNERLIFKPWASWILRRFFPNAKLTNKHQHPN